MSLKINLLIMLSVLSFLMWSYNFMIRFSIRSTPQDFVDWRDCIHSCRYINLARREDRNRQMLSMFDKYSFPSDKITRINAIEDHPGFTGCTKSHLKSVQNIRVFQGNEFLVIMEDDFEPIVNVFEFHKQINEAMQFLNFDFDVLFMAMTPIKLEETSVKRLHRVRCALGMAGLIINIKYLPKMIDIYQQSLKQKKPHDLITQLYQPRDKWYGFFPPIARQRPNYSDIEKRFTDYHDLEVQGVLLNQA